MFREIFKLLAKDNLHVQALNQCYEMVDICHRMVLASMESLRRRDDAAVDIDIYEMDKKLNAFERGVRRKVMTHLSLGHTADISSGLTLVSIVIDIERIGDYSKNIYDLAVNHPTRLDGGPLEERLQEIEKEALDVFSGSVEDFKSGNMDEARRLMSTYKDNISGPCSEFTKALVGGKVELPSAEAAALGLYVRFLKRIAAHSRNLISSLVNPFDRIGYAE
ncbi:MAG: PhoU domain-containing protein [Planctomycetota bacterium]|jgi:phosphate uptake regulator